MHFFNPVPMMALVELIRGLQTSDETVAAVEALAKALGKTPDHGEEQSGFRGEPHPVPDDQRGDLRAGRGPGLAGGNRRRHEAGLQPSDRPLALADMIGLDTMLAVMNVFYEGFNDSKYRPAPLLKEMVAAGYLGRKTGRGFYQY
jgi:3-hydroxybutyryl-CoA dehydrogenase